MDWVHWYATCFFFFYNAAGMLVVPPARRLAHYSVLVGVSPVFGRVWGFW